MNERRAPRTSGAPLALAALTLFAASAVHFGAAVTLGGVSIHDPFPDAAIPESVLGVIVALGALYVIARFPRSWTAGAATVVVAILVVLLGLSITVRGGRVGDVAYHLALLGVLVADGILLLRARIAS